MQNFYQDKTILITGAAGFIATELVSQVLALGARVIGIDNFLTGRRSNIQHLLTNPNFKLIEADLINFDFDQLQQEQFTAVFHLASPASPPRYQAHPRETYLVNSLVTDKLLACLQQHQPQSRLLFASTSEVYGDPLQHPQTENYWGNVNPNGIRSCYDEAKRLGETICGVFYRHYHFDTRIVRIFNTYGEKMDPIDGRVIPNFITQALKHEPLTIYGDGQQTRSYCYVKDLVAGILKFMAADNLTGETINLGNPEEYTILETASIIQKLVNGRVNDTDFIFKPLPGDDPSKRKPDISKAQQLLAWQPNTSLDDGLKKTIAYFSSN